MIILAVETSTMTTSVALVEGPRPAARPEDVVVRASGEAVAAPASDNLMPLIERALADAGVALAAVDAFAVGAGPGSFTGLRIGMATVKGLAFAAGKPVWAVSSLEALALGAGGPEGALIAAAIDARRGEVFSGWFRKGQHWLTALGSERVLLPAELASWSAELPAAPRLLLGDGAIAYRADLAGIGQILERPATPLAEAVGRLALSRELPDALAAGAPTYVRPGPPLPKRS